MNINVIQSAQINIPANTSVWATLPVEGANVLSSGLQNLGYKTNCYASQLFVTSANAVFYQVDNHSDAAVIIIINITADGAATIKTAIGTGTSVLKVVL